MNVLSLFNGMSFGMMALESLGIEVNHYYSSEIDKYANQATEALYPEITQVEDVTKWREWDVDLSNIDLLLAGFPCQAWSKAGNEGGDSDPRGALVHDLIDIWTAVNKQRAAYGKPTVKFMFENVRMKKQFLDYINTLFGVEPICINSALVSAQNRVRYYWSNTDTLLQPEDRGLVVADILEPHLGSTCQVLRTGDLLVDRKIEGGSRSSGMVFLGGLEAGLRLHDGKKLSRNYREGSRIYSIYGKSATLTAQSKGGKGGYSGLYGIATNEGIKYRKLTVGEVARLQTVPEDKIQVLLDSGVSNTQLYKMLGNGWNLETVKHVLSGLNK